MVDVDLITSLVSSVGFPILSCGALGFYIYWNEKKNTESEEKRENRLYEEIRYNREVNKELLETNRILAKDINYKIDEVIDIVKNTNSKGE